MFLSVLVCDLVSSFTRLKIWPPVASVASDSVVVDLLFICCSIVCVCVLFISSLVLTL